MNLSPDYGQTTILNAKNMAGTNEQLPVTITCRPDAASVALAACGSYRSLIPIPAVGSHVALIGPLVTDTQSGWRVLRPVWRADPIAERVPETPASATHAKAVWVTIRARWPAVPPVIVIADLEASGGIATSAFYPDGLAHLFVTPNSLLDDHAIWHEAGHMLHAAALVGRGALPSLYRAEDPVGNDYWRVRGFPGTWAGSLSNTSWSLLGYEALAETFAAANLGDREKTADYGVALDRDAMLAFFAALQSAVVAH